MAGLGQYLDAAARAVQAQDGSTLAALLSDANDDAVAAVGDALRTNRALSLGTLCEQKVPAPFDEIFAHHCQCLAAMGEGRHEDAFTAMTASVQAFVKDFRNQETAWSLDALVRLVRNCRNLADKADEASVAAGKKASKLHDAGALLMLVYRNTTNTSVK